MKNKKKKQRKRNGKEPMLHNKLKKVIHVRRIIEEIKSTIYKEKNIRKKMSKNKKSQLNKTRRRVRSKMESRNKI